MKEHSEGFFKAKEMVDAIRDIDYLLEQYDDGIQVLSSECDKNRFLKTIFNHIRYIFSGKKEKCLDFVEVESQFSSEFMVDLHDFLVEERSKFEKKLKILE